MSLLRKLNCQPSAAHFVIPTPALPLKGGEESQVKRGAPPQMLRRSGWLSITLGADGAIQSDRINSTNYWLARLKKANLG
jgi:hypothetical protein